MEQSPLPAVEPGPENPGQGQEQKARFQVPTGLIQRGRTLPATVPISPVPSGERARLLLTAVTATSCRAGEGGSKKQNNQNHGQRPRGENPGYVAVMCHQEGPQFSPSRRPRASTTTCPPWRCLFLMLP